MGENTDERATTDDQVSWRELAVARSLDSARTRAENRVQRFIDAALELMAANDGKEFTVQEVVERSGQSLRSFYQYFGGKHELLLALFEEAIRTTAEQLAASLDEGDEPIDRLRGLVLEYYAYCRPSTKPAKGGRPGASSPVLVEFAQQLLTSHSAEAARAFVPLVALFETELDRAAAAGVIRDGVDRRRVAGVMLEAIMFNVFSSTIAGTAGEASAEQEAQELWNLFAHGIGADVAPATNGRKSSRATK